MDRLSSKETQQAFDDGLSPNFGYNQRQIVAIGEDWPLRTKGWKKAWIAKGMTADQAYWFVLLRTRKSERLFPA